VSALPSGEPGYHRASMRALAATFVLLSLVSMGTALAGCPNIGSCKPANVNGVSGTCSGSSGWVWNGSSCIHTQKCVCTGDDCQSFYDDRETCEAAHAHCF
jgi:hypothetical protein